MRPIPTTGHSRVDHALDHVRVRLGQRRNRQQSGDLLAPQVQALVQRGAATAGRQVKLRLPCFARAREPESEPSDKALAVATAIAGKPQQLTTTRGENVLERPLHRPRR
jgi:hypothetical protein